MIMERDIMVHLTKTKWNFPQNEKFIKKPNLKFKIKTFDGDKQEMNRNDIKINDITDKILLSEVLGRGKKHLIEIEYDNDIRPSTILIECEIRDKEAKEPGKIITKHILEIYCAPLEECGIFVI